MYITGLSGCASGINLEYYNGTNILTDGGRRCQEWSKQTPHSHPLWSTDAEFPFDESIDAANKFCRNNGESIPWCYTWDPDKRIEYCGTQICGGISWADPEGGNRGSGPPGKSQQAIVGLFRNSGTEPTQKGVQLSRRRSLRMATGA